MFLCVYLAKGIWAFDKFGRLLQKTVEVHYSYTTYTTNVYRHIGYLQRPLGSMIMLMEIVKNKVILMVWGSVDSEPLQTSYCMLGNVEGNISQGRPARQWLDDNEKNMAELG